MPHTGITTRKSTCAICKKSMPVGEFVYFDPLKSQGNHLVHSKCWTDLLKERGPLPKPKKNPVALSTEPLDPDF